MASDLSACHQPCVLSDWEVCGGPASSIVYKTGNPAIIEPAPSVSTSLKVLSSSSDDKQVQIKTLEATITNKEASPDTQSLAVTKLLQESITIEPKENNAPKDEVIQVCRD